MRIATVILDGLGADEMKEVPVDVLKFRFFILGLQAGLALAMCALSILMVAASHDSASAVEELSGLYYPLFRGIFLLAFFSCLYGVLLFLWKRSGIAYGSIFGIKQAQHNYHSVIRAGFTLVSINFLAFVLYFLTLAINLTPTKDLWPLCALVGSIAFLAWPGDHMPEWSDASQRAALARTVLRTIAAPFSSASFAHCFVADVCCSMPKVFIDLLYVTCLYGSRGALDQCAASNPPYRAAFVLLSVLPFWVRLMQCVRGSIDTPAVRRRNFANGVKYTCQISVVTLSFATGRSYAWLAMSILSTLYAGIWDVLVDWGLGPRWARKLIHGDAAIGHEQSDTSWLLRPVHCFPPTWYYAIAAVNSLARLGWSIYISDDHANLIAKQHVTLVLGAIELYRRAQWALLRVEWEQIKRTSIELAAATAANHTESQVESLRAKLLENQHKMESRYFVQ